MFPGVTSFFSMEQEQDEKAQTRPTRPQSRSLSALADEWGEDVSEVNLTDYDAETESAMK